MWIVREFVILDMGSVVHFHSHKSDFIDGKLARIEGRRPEEFFGLTGSVIIWYDLRR